MPSSRPWWARIVVIGVLAAAVVVSLPVDGAEAGEPMTTTPDACDILGRPTAARQLGSRVRAIPQPFELPDRGRHRDPLEETEVLQTGCTWIDVASLATSCDDEGKGGCGVDAINVQVYQRNGKYTGKRQWDPGNEAWRIEVLGNGDVIAKVARPGKPHPPLGAKGYVLIPNDALAKTSKAPWLAGDRSFVAVDRKTRGRRIAILGYTVTSDLFVVVSVLSDRAQRALHQLVAVSRDATL